MKKRIIAIIAIFMCFRGSFLTAQNTVDSNMNTRSLPLTAEQFLSKSQSQKKTATLLGIGGGTLLVTGMALTLGDLSHLMQPGNHTDNSEASTILSVTGAALCVGAIILRQSGRKNKKLANLSMQTESLKGVPGKNNAIQLASLSIKIRL